MNELLEQPPASQMAIDIADTWQFDNSNLAEIISKLRYGGKLFVSGVDAKELSRVFFLGGLDLDSFNRLISQRTMSTMPAAIAYFSSLGLKVIEKGFDELYFHLTFERAKNV